MSIHRTDSNAQGSASMYGIDNRPYSQHFEASVDMFGDKTTLTQIVLLLTYIRYHIQNKIPGDIKVSIGKRLETEAFSFSVNEQEVPQIKPEKEIEIN